MKFRTFKIFFALSLFSLLITACDALKDLDFVVTPKPLEMHGDSVAIQVTVKVQRKELKKIVAELSPMYGELALDPIRLNGEKIETGDKTIPYKPGGTVTYFQK